LLGFSDSMYVWPMKRPLTLVSIVLTFSICCGSQTGPGSSTALKLLIRPPAGYTEDAKRAQAQGVITLTAEFCADGKIGKVLLFSKIIESSVSKMDAQDYGLANNAIEAAKRIEFLPATVDDKPVNVTKKVEYVFELYPGSYKRH
jgi:hypothetical protein